MRRPRAVFGSETSTSPSTATSVCDTDTRPCIEVEYPPASAIREPLPPHACRCSKGVRCIEAVGTRRVARTCLTSLADHVRTGWARSSRWSAESATLRATRFQRTASFNARTEAPHARSGQSLLTILRRVSPNKVDSKTRRRVSAACCDTDARDEVRPDRHSSRSRSLTRGEWRGVAANHSARYSSTVSLRWLDVGGRERERERISVSATCASRRVEKPDSQRLPASSRDGIREAGQRQRISDCLSCGVWPFMPSPQPSYLARYALSYSRVHPLHHDDSPSFWCLSLWNCSTLRRFEQRVHFFVADTSTSLGRCLQVSQHCRWSNGRFATGRAGEGTRETRAVDPRP